MKTLHQLLRGLVRKCLASNMGEKLFQMMAQERLLLKKRNRTCRIPDEWASMLDLSSSINFEDLAWLFSCNPLNRGIIRMDLDEAAYLFWLVRGLRKAVCVEIGRAWGGSTLLMAAGLDEDSKLISIDVSPSNDAVLRETLRQCRLDRKVDLVVDDANHVSCQPYSYKFVFIDGDHRYEHVRKDYQHWKSGIKRGGHLLFHDAGHGREDASRQGGPARVVSEIEKGEQRYFKKVTEIGSLVHFLRTDTPFNPP